MAVAGHSVVTLGTLGLATVGAGILGGLPGAVAVALIALVGLASGRLRAGPAAGPVALKGDGSKLTVPLLEREEISHDVRRFRFGLPTPAHTLGLPLGKHINLIATINGETEIRTYTPVSAVDDKGYFDLVIKVYFKNVHPKFPDGGKMSQHLNNLPIGGTVDIRGPAGHITYKGRGQFSLQKTKSAPIEARKREREKK